MKSGSVKFHLKMRSSVVWERDSIMMKQTWRITLMMMMMTRMLLTWVSWG